jgi:hypothetical protein
MAVATDDVAAKEEVVLWLRGELRKLRDSKKATLARVQIADLAMTMLETASLAGIGKNLLGLFRELLGVDVHRKRITPNEKLMDAAVIDGQALQDGKLLGVRELARRVGVNPRAIVDWRRLPFYHREIAKGLGASPRDVARILTINAR